VDRQRVVALIVISICGGFHREAEKIAKESRSEKIAASCLFCHCGLAVSLPRG
jgi:hypothetical protein